MNDELKELIEKILTNPINHCFKGNSDQVLDIITYYSRIEYGYKANVEKIYTREDFSGLKENASIIECLYDSMSDALELSDAIEFINFAQMYEGINWHCDEDIFFKLCLNYNNESSTAFQYMLSNGFQMNEICSSLVDQHPLDSESKTYHLMKIINLEYKLQKSLLNKENIRTKKL